jgi:hypothetical protein
MPSGARPSSRGAFLFGGWGSSPLPRPAFEESLDSPRPALPVTPQARFGSTRARRRILSRAAGTRWRRRRRADARGARWAQRSTRCWGRTRGRSSSARPSRRPPYPPPRRALRGCSKLRPKLVKAAALRATRLCPQVDCLYAPFLERWSFQARPAPAGNAPGPRIPAGPGAALPPLEGQRSLAPNRHRHFTPPPRPAPSSRCSTRGSSRATRRDGRRSPRGTRASRPRRAPGPRARRPTLLPPSSGGHSALSSPPARAPGASAARGLRPLCLLSGCLGRGRSPRTSLASRATATRGLSRSRAPAAAPPLSAPPPGPTTTATGRRQARRRAPAPPARVRRRAESARAAAGMSAAEAAELWATFAAGRPGAAASAPEQVPAPRTQRPLFGEQGRSLAGATPPPSPPAGACDRRPLCARARAGGSHPRRKPRGRCAGRCQGAPRPRPRPRPRSRPARPAAPPRPCRPAGWPTGSPSCPDLEGPARGAGMRSGRRCRGGGGRRQPTPPPAPRQAASVSRRRAPCAASARRTARRAASF